MERGSDKHGRRLDEAMERETRGLVQAGRDTRGEEWKSAEPSGEDQPEVDRNPAGTLHGGLPEGLTDRDIEGRAELGALLGKGIWPAETPEIQSRVREQDGRDAVIDLVDRLPPGRVYANVAEVWEDLTGAREDHRF